MKDIMLRLFKNLLVLVEILYLAKQKYMLVYTSNYGMIWYGVCCVCVCVRACVNTTIAIYMYYSPFIFDFNFYIHQYISLT